MTGALLFLDLAKVSLTVLPLTFFFSSFLQISWLWASFFSGKFSLLGGPQQFLAYNLFIVLGSKSYWNDLDLYSMPVARAWEHSQVMCVPLSSGVRDIPAKQCGFRVERRQVFKGKSDLLLASKNLWCLLGVCPIISCRRWMISHSENLFLSCWTELLDWDMGLIPALHRETVFSVLLI